MKRYAFTFIALLAAAVAYGRSLTADTTQTGTVNCTALAGSPTLVFSNDPNATKSFVVNYSTNNIFLGFQSTTSTATPAAFSISTSSGNFYLVANSTLTWSPDGTQDNFTGPMWCVGGGQGAPLTRIRMH